MKRTVKAMSLPGNIPQLSAPDPAEANEADVARSLEEAAKLVQEFTHEGATGTLDALLASAEAGPGESAKRALELAKSVAKQSETLNAEAERFLSSAKLS